MISYSWSAYFINVKSVYFNPGNTNIYKNQVIMSEGQVRAVTIWNSCTIEGITTIKQSRLLVHEE